MSHAYQYFINHHAGNRGCGIGLNHLINFAQACVDRQCYVANLHLRRCRSLRHSICDFRCKRAYHYAIRRRKVYLRERRFGCGCMVDQRRSRDTGKRDDTCQLSLAQAAGLPRCKAKHRTLIITKYGPLWHRTNSGRTLNCSVRDPKIRRNAWIFARPRHSGQISFT